MLVLLRRSWLNDGLAIAERFLRIRFTRNLNLLLLSTESYMPRLRLGNQRSVQNAFSNREETFTCGQSHLRITSLLCKDWTLVEKSVRLLN
jgi:hypothetical protein